MNMGSSKEVESVVSRSIQEMAINGEKPTSDKFFYRGTSSTSNGGSGASVPLIQIPVLDLGLLTNTHSSPSITSQQQLDNLRLALTSWGCFQLPDGKTEPKQKTVQELVMNGDEPPRRYFYEGGVGDQDHSLLPLLDIPIIDMAHLTTNTGQLEEIHSALTSFGCFMFINHGMTSSFLDKLRSLMKQFFALPMEEKQKYSREADSIEGYGNDIIFSEDQILDWDDRLYLKVNPEDERQLKFWPEKPQDFKETLSEYTWNLKMITEVVLKAMAKSLNLEENCFLDKYGERPIMFARFNFFPPCPLPDRALGLKPHSDGSAVTIVLQDQDVEGFQVQKDNQWFRVPIIPHALLVNAGDQVEMLSNGLFKSPVHRVVTNPERVRTSVAMFCSPDANNEIEPFEGLVSETRPALYKKVKDYTATYFGYYQKGKRPIEEMKV